ncbi:MAG: hypothetical protein JXR37_33165 [Kiritimatiellae bacterium]|nr:hypothetical protein [Kiritimatiellia bacterium]
MKNLRPYTKNPMYWEHDGKPRVLLGGSFQDNPWQWAGENLPALLKHLDILKDAGGNYIRCTISSRRHAFPYCDTSMAYPFRHLADGRYDPTQWNEDYFERLRVFLAACDERDIVAQLEIWDTYSVTGGQGAWDKHAWNPANHVNGNGRNIALPNVRAAFFTPAAAQDPVLGELQRRYVRKTLETSFEFGNVLYQLDNESPWPHDYSDYWATFIHECARARGKEVFVCDSRRYHSKSFTEKEFRTWAHPENAHPITNSQIYNFCDISQNGGNIDDTHYENLLWYRAKVREHKPRPINHVKMYGFIWPTGEEWGWEKNYRYAPNEKVNRSGWRFWRSIFGGAASIRFHRDNCEKAETGYVDTNTNGGGMGLSPGAQRHIRSMRMLLDAMHIFTMEPRNDLITSTRAPNQAFVLAEPGRQYAVYFTGATGSNKATLAVEPGRYAVNWLDILNAAWGTESVLDLTGDCALEAPSGDSQWAALLKRHA